MSKEVHSSTMREGGNILSRVVVGVFQVNGSMVDVKSALRVRTTRVIVEFGQKVTGVLHRKKI